MGEYGLGMSWENRYLRWGLKSRGWMWSVHSVSFLDSFLVLHDFLTFVQIFISFRQVVEKSEQVYLLLGM